MKLTVAEQAAYGYVFAAEYRAETRIRPNHIPYAEIEGWERRMAVSAAEVAWSVVDRMREIRPDMVKAFGDGTDVVEMYDACTPGSKE